MHAKRAARTVEKTGESKSTPQRSLSVRCWTVKLKSRRGGGRAGRTAKRAATVLCDPAKRTRPGDRGGRWWRSPSLIQPPVLASRPTPLSRLLRLKPLPNSASCCPSAAANRPTGAAPAPPWPAPAPSWAAEPLRTLPTPRGPASRLGRFRSCSCSQLASVSLSLQHDRFAAGIAIFSLVPQ